MDTSHIVNVTPIYGITCPIRHSLNQAMSWLEAKAVVVSEMPGSDLTHARIRKTIVRLEETLRDLDSADAALARLRKLKEIPPEDRYDGYEGEECEGEIDSLDHRHLYRD